MIAEEESERYRADYSHQYRAILDRESERALLRHRIEALEYDREKDRRELTRLRETLNITNRVSDKCILG